MCYLHEFVAHWGQESILIFCNPVFHIDLKSTAVHFDVICAAECNLWDSLSAVMTALSKRTHKVQNAEVGVSKSGWSTRVKGCCLISNIMLSCRPNGILCNVHNATMGAVFTRPTLYKGYLRSSWGKKLFSLSFLLHRWLYILVGFQSTCN